MKDTFKKTLFTGAVIFCFLTANLRAELVGYWKFDKAFSIGADWFTPDSSGNLSTGTIYGGGYSTDGKYGKARHFNGSDDYVDCGAGSNLNITGPFTIAAWVKTDTTFGARNIITKGDSAYGIQLENDNNIRFYCGGNWIDSSPVNNNEWVHVAAVYTGSAMKLYKNGSEVNNVPFTANPSITASGLIIGAHADHFSQFFNGLIDDVRVYNNAMNGSQVLTLYQTPALYWEQAGSDGFGLGYKTVALGAWFDNKLYAGVDDSISGGEVFAYNFSGNSWDNANGSGAGFGDSNNTYIFPSVATGGYIYAGTANSVTGGQVWRSADGYNWSRIGAESLNNPSDSVVYPAVVFNNHLYCGVSDYTNGGTVGKFPGGTIDWSWESSNDGFGNPNNTDVFPSVGFDNYIYAGTVNSVTGGEIWRRYISGALDSWEQVNTNGFGNANNLWAFPFCVLGSYIYAGTYNDVTGCEVWRSGDSTWTQWEQVNTSGFGDSNNISLDMAAYGGCIYAVTENPVTGTEVWRSSPDPGWEQVNDDGFGDSNNTGGVTVKIFNDHIYISADNTATGCEVWDAEIPADLSGDVVAGDVLIGSNRIRKNSSDETTIYTGVTQSGTLEVTVYDVAGKVIKKWEQGVSAGAPNFTWDGKTDDGNYPSRGIYFMKIEGMGIDTVKPVVISR